MVNSLKYNLVLVLLFAVVLAGAQFSEITDAQLINSSYGLSNNDINDLYQDGRGYLWIATDDGLNRYDGYEHVVFRPLLSDSSSISSQMIHAIAEDSNGDIWVGTDRGLSMCDIETSRFDNIVFYSSGPGENRNRIIDIVFSNDTTVYCLLTSSVIQYNILSNTFREFDLKSLGYTFAIHRSGLLYYDNFHGTLLLGSMQGLLYLDEVKGEVKAVSSKKYVINTIFFDKSGVLWMGTNKGLARCKWSEKTSKPVSCELVLSNRDISAIGQSENNRLILTSGSKMILFEQNTHEVIGESSLALFGLKDVFSIRTMLVDKSQNLWLATGGGICRLGMKKLQFSYYNSETEDFTLSNNMISSVLSSGSKLYIGSWGGGLEVLDLDSRQQTYYSRNISIDSFPDNGVNVIFKDSKDRLWVLSDKVYILNESKGGIIPASEYLDFLKLRSIENSRIYAMKEIYSGVYLIAHQNGIYLIDENKHVFRDIAEIEIDSGLLQLRQVRCIEIDGDDIWLGSEPGIIKFHLEGGGNAFFPIHSANGVINHVLTLKLDSRKLLWVGTPLGLFSFDPEEEVFHSYSVEDGLANDYIYSLEEDNKGLLWMGTNKGIINLNPRSGEIRNFGVQHGLSSMEFNLNASFLADNGLMMFGCINGLNFFHPDSLFKNRNIPKIEITGIRHFKRDDQIYQPFVPAEYVIRENETLQLFFSLLDFTDPKYKVYRYRVSSASSTGSWNIIGKENSIILSGLPYGKYRIEILGAASDEQWSINSARLNLIVEAPFYRHKAFIVFMMLPCLALVYFLFEYRMKTLKKSNRALREKEIAAREVLRQKNLLSRRNKGIEDSLKYAQRIQYAMFTSEIEIKKMFPDSFILQKPKDIVSGDFYWAKKIGSKVFIAAADCTGHGVPGAFMSLIGLEFFRQIIGGQGVHRPSLILDEINRNFDLIFENEKDIEMRDGMDLALCVIDTNTNILEYSGAFSPLYILRDGEIMEYKADKIMLGPDLGYGRPQFKNNIIELKENDTLYIFSDGYADQFGGPEGKKFKFRRFRHLLLSIYDQPFHIQQKILENSIVDWQGEFEQVDDILVVGFRPVITM